MQLTLPTAQYVGGLIAYVCTLVLIYYPQCCCIWYKEGENPSFIQQNNIDYSIYYAHLLVLTNTGK